MVSLSAPSQETLLIMATRTGQYNDAHNQIGMHILCTEQHEKKYTHQSMHGKILQILTNAYMYNTCIYSAVKLIHVLFSFPLDMSTVQSVLVRLPLTR